MDIFAVSSDSSGEDSGTSSSENEHPQRKTSSRARDSIVRRLEFKFQPRAAKAFARLAVLPPPAPPSVGAGQSSGEQAMMVISDRSLSRNKRQEAQQRMQSVCDELQTALLRMQQSTTSRVNEVQAVASAQVQAAKTQVVNVTRLLLTTRDALEAATARIAALEQHEEPTPDLTSTTFLMRPDVQALMQHHKTKVGSLEMTVATLQSEHSTLGARCKQLQSENELLRQQIELQQRRLNLVEQRVAESLAAHRATIAENNILKSTVQEMSDLNNELHLQLSAMETNHTELIARAEVSTSQIGDLQSQLVSTTASIALLEHQLAETRSELATEQQNKKCAIAQLSAQLSTSSSKLQLMHDEVSRAKLGVAAAEFTSLTATTRADSLERRVADLDAANAQLAMQLASERSRCEQLAGMCDTLRKMNADAESRCAAAETRACDTSAELKQLQRDVDDLLLLTGEQVVELDALKAKLTAADAAIAATKVAHSSDATALVDLRTVLLQASQKLTGLRDELQSPSSVQNSAFLCSGCARLRKQLANTEQQMAALLLANRQ